MIRGTAKLIGEGAEAKVYLDNDVVVKNRIPKSYRISDIDEELRYSRTRKEARVMEKLNKLGINVPRVLSKEKTSSASDSEKSNLTMSFISGTKLRDYLNETNFAVISKEIGKMIATIHNNDIIHGDLTTSNMIYNYSEKDVSKRLYFVDFGLSFVSTKVEDKAVDLHLLKQALESYHYKFWDKAFKIISDEYIVHGDKLVLDRLEVVELRGRNKH